MDPMKTCPYCMADIPEQAQKCMHCGEWVEEQGRPQRASDYLDSVGDDLGTAANTYVNLKIVMFVVGVLVMLAFFFLFFLPMWNKADERINNPPQIPFHVPNNPGR